MPESSMTPDDMLRFIMPEQQNPTPEQEAYMEEMKASVQKEVQEIYERVKAEVEAERKAQG